MSVERLQGAREDLLFHIVAGKARAGTRGDQAFQVYSGRLRAEVQLTVDAGKARQQPLQHRRKPEHQRQKICGERPC